MLSETPSNLAEIVLSTLESRTIRAPLLINTRKRKRPGTGPQGPSDNPQSGTNTKTQTQKGPPGFLFKKRVNNKMVKKDLVKRDYEDREHGEGTARYPGTLCVSAQNNSRTRSLSRPTRGIERNPTSSLTREGAAAACKMRVPLVMRYPRA